jgi:hypothetical protein
MQPVQKQASLFIPVTTIVDTPVTIIEPINTSREPPHPATVNIEVTRDELINQIITDVADNRRWERQLVLGATNDELARSFGICFLHSQRYTVAFHVDPSPHAICSDLNDNEILTISADEIANAVRAITHIPEPPGPEETTRLIAEQLDKERIIARSEIFYSVKGIIKDTAKKKEVGFTQQFVDLLFTENCLLEENEAHILYTITTLLTQRQWRTAKAMKAAIDIVRRAQSTWRMIEFYWRDLPGDWWEPSHYIPPPTTKTTT